MRKLLYATLGWLAVLCVTAALASAHTISVDYCHASLNGRTSQAGDDDMGSRLATWHNIYGWTFTRPSWPSSAYRIVIGGVPSPHWLRLTYAVYGNYGFFGYTTFDCWVDYGGNVYNVDFPGQTYHDG